MTPFTSFHFFSPKIMHEKRKIKKCWDRIILSSQVSSTTIILSGGLDTGTLVSELCNLSEEVTTRQLPKHIDGRYHHGCGWYMVGKSQVRPKLVGGAMMFFRCSL